MVCINTKKPDPLECFASATYKISAPTATISAEITDENQNTGGVAWSPATPGDPGVIYEPRIAFGRKGKPGITINANIIEPNDQVKGSYGFIQLASVDHNVSAQNDSDFQKTLVYNTEGFVLDDGGITNINDPFYQFPGSVTDGTGVISMDDTPSFGTTIDTQMQTVLGSPSDAYFSNMILAGDFKTTLLFKARNPDSIFIPLGVIDWSFSGIAIFDGHTEDNGGWRIHEGHSTWSAVVAPSFPEWNRDAKSIIFKAE